MNAHASAGSSSTSLTLLFTDIEGSTSLWVEHPDGAGGAVGLHDEIIAEAITGHGGNVIKTTGDGFLASFQTVRSGVAAAVDAQLALAKRGDELLNAARVRMALHSGTVEERKGDLFGLAVNKCERIMAAASAGQILLSSAAAAALRDDLPPGGEIVDLGDQRFRGFPGVERVYQFAQPGLRREFPALTTAAHVSTNLPLELSSFIGRDRELNEVSSLVSEHRLVTLTGEGGAGKTRMAIQTGSVGLEHFPGGVWFIELDSLQDPSLVVARIASALGLEERAGRTHGDVVVDHLKDKKALLIVDNCEHVLDAAALIVDSLLKGVPDLHVLATSRQRLGVPSEVAYRLPPMSIPEPDGDLAAVGGHDSVRLFVERAQLARPAFRLSPDNAAAVGRIARQLDGLPLALELAAAKVAMLTPAQIADHLDGRFRMLTDGTRTAMPRHQTLDAAIEWSYELLPDGERRLFAVLSVFRGGFDLGAAEYVGLGAGDDEVLIMLAALVDKSLVVADVEVGRYRLLETIRQYASARLSEAGESEACAARHAGYYVEFAETAGPGLDGPDQASWLAALETEGDNLRAALKWSLDHDPMTLRLMAAIWRFWLLRCRPTEGRDWLRRALASEAAGTDRWRVQALLGSAALASRQGDQEAARAVLVDATQLAESVGDHRAAAAALAAIAVIHHKEGDVRAATASFRDALARARQVSDPLQTSRVLINLALLLEDQGEQEEAARSAQEALAVSESTGIPDLIADAMLTAGEIALNHGHAGSARSLLEGALHQGMETGVDDITAWAQSYLGKIALQSGDFKASRALLGEAIEKFRTMESPMGIEWALRHLALAELKSGEIDSACDSADEALRLASEHVRPDTPYVLQVSGEIAATTNQYGDAVVVLTAARRLGIELELRLPAFESAEFDLTWQAASAALPEAELDAAKARGDSLTLDEAVHVAQAILAARPDLGHQA